MTRPNRSDTVRVCLELPLLRSREVLPASGWSFLATVKARTRGGSPMGIDSIVFVVVIVLIVLFVLGYFGRGRMRG